MLPHVSRKTSSLSVTEAIADVTTFTEDEEHVMGDEKYGADCTGVPDRILEQLGGLSSELDDCTTWLTSSLKV